MGIGCESRTQSKLASAKSRERAASIRQGTVGIRHTLGSVLGCSAVRADTSRHAQLYVCHGFAVFVFSS